MVDNSSTHVRKVGGVRFAVDTTDSSNKHEENPRKTTELQWEQCCENHSSFDLYFGILKLSHSYTMTMDVVFHQIPVKLEIILDHQHTDGLQLLVTELPKSSSENRISFQIEVVINPETIPGPFHRTFLLEETATTEQRSVRINVSGKILRQGQGTPTLKDGVHMKSIIIKENDDDE